MERTVSYEKLRVIDVHTHFPIQNMLAAPTTRDSLVRACSSETGLRFCGMIDEPCTRSSSSR